MDKGIKRSLSSDDDDDTTATATTTTYEHKKFAKSFDMSVNNKRKENSLSDDSDTEELNHTKRLKPNGQNDKQSGGKYEKMLGKMGWKSGQGLGRHNQGRVAPIDESDQKGRRGLGFKLEHFDKKVDEWNYDEDQININEPPQWLYNNDSNVPELNVLLDWIEEGNKKLILDDEDEFCSFDVVTDVLKCKSIFDNLENREMTQARTRSNPFETIAGCIFQNRAAMKMANIDTAFNFMFTNPKDAFGKSKIDEDEPLYFCDICSGPGGFSEYVLWRKKCTSKGFGMTLKGDCDFKIDEFLSGAPEFFEQFYGKNGLDGDGDITNPMNLKEFENFILQSTNYKGVHFVMADGGFSVEGNENIQEILSKQLYLCQFLCALSVLRTGGNFVCKLFDLFTPFSCGLVYLMYLCFERICIYKPVTSRPANSERLGKIQILNLKKIQAFASNPNLIDTRQADIRDECLKLWKIPDENRFQLRLASGYVRSNDHHQHHHNRHNNRNHKQMKLVINPDDVFRKLNDELKTSKVKLDIKKIFGIGLRELTSTSLVNDFKRSSVYDYRCMLSCGNLYLLLGCGRSRVFQCCIDGNMDSASFKWEPVNDIHIELPRGTLALAEKVTEFRGEDKGQRSLSAVHILDMYFLFGMNLLVQNDKVVSLMERRANLKVFEHAINKRSRPDLTLIRVKDLIRFEQLNSVFDLLIQRRSKRSQATNYAIDLPALHQATDHYIYPRGCYLFKFVSSPWSVLFSKSHQQKYFYNYNTNISSYSPPGDDSFCANPKLYWDFGYIWKWTNEVLHDADTDENTNYDSVNSSVITKKGILEFIASKV